MKKNRRTGFIDSPKIKKETPDPRSSIKWEANKRSFGPAGNPQTSFSRIYYDHEKEGAVSMEKSGPASVNMKVVYDEVTDIKMGENGQSMIENFHDGDEERIVRVFNCNPEERKKRESRKEMDQKSTARKKFSQKSNKDIHRYQDFIYEVV